MPWSRVIITAIWNPSFALAILLPCQTMEMEWDEQRRHTNIAKHGVDFVAAARVFDGPILEVEDRRRDYAEMRFLALGELRDRQSPSFILGAAVAAVSSVPEGRVAMNDRGIMRVSKDQLAEMIDETDWARVAAMTDADIERAAAEDPDASLTTAGDWKGAGRLAAGDGTGHATARSGRPRMVSAAGTGVSGAYQCGPSRLRQGARALADPCLRQDQVQLRR